MAIVCCAWSEALSNQSAGTSCHHVEMATGPVLGTGTAHRCEPYELGLNALPDSPQQLGADPQPAWKPGLREQTLVERFVGRRPDPVPILHVPKHLLDTVLLI